MQQYRVHIVADGISSQRPLDRTVGLTRMQAMGAHLTSAESQMFEWLRDKNNPYDRAQSRYSPHPYLRNLFALQAIQAGVSAGEATTASRGADCSLRLAHAVCAGGSEPLDWPFLLFVQAARLGNPTAVQYLGLTGTKEDFRGLVSIHSICY